MEILQSFRKRNQVMERTHIMKKFFLMAVAVASAAMLSACASVTVVKDPYINNLQLANDGSAKIAHVNVQNSGLYFLWFPLLSGDTDNPGTLAFLKDTVNLQSTAPIMTRKSKELGGKKVLDMTSQVSEWSFIFCIRSVNISGNVVK